MDIAPQSGYTWCYQHHMTKKLIFTALSLALVLGIAAPVQAEIVDYGYGNTYGSSYGYGTTYDTQYPSYGTNVTIVRDLTIGSYGADVQALEAFLRARGYMVSQGVGYFSTATRDGVARFQAASGIFPASGYFGPVTRAYFNMLSGSMQNQYPNYGTQYPYGTGYQYSYQSGCPSGTYAVNYGSLIGCLSNSSNNDDDDNDDLDGGSASIRSFSFEERETDLEEGDSDVEVGRAEFRVTGGDVRVERVEFRFESVGDSDTDEEPWKVFDRVRLTCDNDEVAEMDVDDDSDWDRDGDGYIVRLDDIDEDCVIDEGDDADLRLSLDIADSVDGANDSDVEWEIAVADDGIRVIDGDDDRHEIGGDGETVTITITD